MRHVIGQMSVTPRLLFALLCLLLPERMAGAQVRSEDPRTASPVQVAPFYLTPTVALTELGIDTNVFNEAGETQQDFTFTITPGLVTAVPIARRGLLKLSTRGDLVYYHRYTSERSINPHVALRGELYLGRFTLFAEPAYHRTRQRPSFEIDARSLRLEQGTVAGAEARVFQKLSVELSVRQLRTTFDGDEFFLGTNLGEALNRDSRTYGVAGRWAFTPLTTLVVRGESITDQFLTSEIRNSDSLRVTGGVELKPRALVSGSAQIGVRRFNPLDVRVPDFTGLVASAELSYTLLGSTTFQVRVDRDANYSFEPLEPYYVASGYGATLRRQLAGRFDAMAGFYRYHYAYRDLASGDLAGSSAPPGRVDVTDSYSASIGYRVGPAGRLGVGFSYWIRDSTTSDSRDYDGLRFGTSFAYGR
jgi:Putative beta-barrel porin 2